MILSSPDPARAGASTDHCARTAPAAGLVLAAGAGVRFGAPKALVRLGGETLLHRVGRTLSDGGCEPVRAVVGASADAVRAAAGSIQTVENPDWLSGMASSLRIGLAALSDATPAVVVALVDQPLVTPAAVGRLIGAWRAGAVVAVATYAGRQRNPVLLDRSVWADLAAGLRGDEGARGWLAAHPALVTAVDCDDVGDSRDVDTPADLADVIAGLGIRPVVVAPPSAVLHDDSAT